MRWGEDNLLAWDCVLSHFAFKDGVTTFIQAAYSTVHSPLQQRSFFLISKWNFCVSSCAFSPVNGYHCQELGSFIPSQQRNFSHGSYSPDFLLTEESQPLPKWQIFLTLNHFCAPLLNLLHCQFCTGEPNAEKITPGVVLPLLRRGRRRNPSSYLLSELSQNSPGYLCPSFLQEHVATQCFDQEEYWVVLGRAAFQPAAL